MHIPPAEIKNVNDAINLLDGFTDITVFESSMNRKSFYFESK